MYTERRKCLELMINCNNAWKCFYFNFYIIYFLNCGIKLPVVFSLCIEDLIKAFSSVEV